MCVAFVSNVVYPWATGGAEKRIHEIGTRLVDKDHSVTTTADTSGTTPQKQPTRT